MDGLEVGFASEARGSWHLPEPDTQVTPEDEQDDEPKER